MGVIIGILGMRGFSGVISGAISIGSFGGVITEVLEAFPACSARQPPMAWGWLGAGSPHPASLGAGCRWLRGRRALTSCYERQPGEGEDKASSFLRLSAFPLLLDAWQSRVQEACRFTSCHAWCFLGSYVLQMSLV